jgi:hypothetical protein
MDHLASGTYKRFKSLIDAVAFDRAAGSNVCALGPSVGDDTTPLRSLALLGRCVGDDGPAPSPSVGGDARDPRPGR